MYPTCLTRRVQTRPNRRWKRLLQARRLFVGGRSPPDADYLNGIAARVCLVLSWQFQARHARMLPGQAHCCIAPAPLAQVLWPRCKDSGLGRSGRPLVVATDCCYRPGNRPLSRCLHFCLVTHEWRTPGAAVRPSLSREYGFFVRSAKIVLCSTRGLDNRIEFWYGALRPRLPSRRRTVRLSLARGRPRPGTPGRSPKILQSR